jgi:hypothetical protein
MHWLSVHADQDADGAAQMAVNDKVEKTAVKTISSAKAIPRF